ncbi:L-idonate 5-dehydrogenase [Sedimentitalea todarodis]|uniref:L-idonate 5-dehydrogenase n=1 Tax=Sedimentitalea todarodis TaxID=1631240 RepID=A0ABU3VHK2_9RHOB|nr:L-idonate 5-dehydrogenase [Sedimentitalea todarodis]MDU9005649.1 L-idonate 5-dehydrogenase [Sedimentitalea todarodis]
MKAVVIHAAEDLRVETCASDPVLTGQVKVRIEAGGICGSDLHYYHDGGFGAVRLREPMILGHEISGTIAEVGEGVTGLAAGDRVAVSPSRPCHACGYCERDLFNHCLNMRFYGSAMPMPHIQGAFREELVADASQCHVIAPEVPAELAAFAEPLSVALHALNRAGDIAGKRVLITGCGPIGALAVLAAKSRGAALVVVTDVIDHVLNIAKSTGADRAINVAENSDWIEDFRADETGFDVMIEASGNQHALRSGLEVLRRRSVLVQVGLGGDASLPLNLLVSKEIDLRGAFRFHAEFTDAVALINAGTLDLQALLSARFPLARARQAFELAGDRTRAMKVQIDFNSPPHNEATDGTT